MVQPETFLKLLTPEKICVALHKFWLDLILFVLHNQRVAHSVDVFDHRFLALRV